MTPTRRLVATAAAAALVAAGAGAAVSSELSPAAAAGPPPGAVTVGGSGQVTGTPDVLRVSAGVHEVAGNVTAALNAANADVARVTAALRKDGVADADIQTSNVAINESYDAHGHPNGYRVDEGLTVLLHDLKAAGRAISDAVGAGGDATRLNGVEFTLQDNAGLLDRARQAAFVDAKQKAERYARLSHRSLGAVKSIEETVHAPVRYPAADAAGALAAAPTPVPVNPGQQAESVTVTVTWTLS